MSVCFLPYMPQAVTMWQSPSSSQSNTSPSARPLPSCRATSSFTFSPTSSPVQSLQQSSSVYLQQSSPTLSPACAAHRQDYGPSSASTTTPLSWKDFPVTSPSPQSVNNLSPPPSAPASSMSSRQPSTPVQYTPEKMHVYSGDLSPLEQCRLRTWPLRQWIYTHRSNPYPTKADKRLLAKQANLREDQVNMWFANTRRRIKKVGMKSWSGGLYNDFQPKPTHDSTGTDCLVRSYPSASDGCPSDDDSFLSGGSTSSDIVLGQF